jgi:hypothetical protein
VHALPPSVRVVGGRTSLSWKSAAEDRYFDPAADDEHGGVGGVSKRFGFADGRLPLVLSHNTPNNSLFLLQEWASNIEDGVFELTDELGTADSVNTKGLTELDGLHWLAEAAFELDGRRIDARPVLLLDDLQYLSNDQHAYLCGALTALREPLGIWASERLEAMRQEDLIGPGVCGRFRGLH